MDTVNIEDLQKDVVNHPEHYERQTSIEHIEAMQIAFRPGHDREHRQSYRKKSGSAKNASPPLQEDRRHDGPQGGNAADPGLQAPRT